jgi:ornithine decarboxylase
VAESGGLLVRVELRRGNSLYINDGTYGSLFDAGSLNWVYPVRPVRDLTTVAVDELTPYSFFGPTCDSLDHMKGPFYLPNDIQEGDFIEIGQLGAYGQAMTTGFNGFGLDPQSVILTDEPLMTMYDSEQCELPLESGWQEPIRLY